MYRDEWLEPAAPPAEGTPPPGAAPSRYVRVKSLEAIRATLDRHGQRDGLPFMAEMARHAGGTYRLERELPRVFEYDRWTAPRAPMYMLEGLACSGAALGEDAPCDRACAMLWHADWPELDAAAAETLSR
jgi:hypothetical protein